MVRHADASGGTSERTSTKMPEQSYKWRKTKLLEQKYPANGETEWWVSQRLREANLEINQVMDEKINLNFVLDEE